jgi:triacylglycerol esterase/lipase EstA (alpha/beta hydrolase family)
MDESQVSAVNVRRRRMAVCRLAVCLAVIATATSCSLLQTHNQPADANAPSWARRLNIFDDASIWDGFFTPGDSNEKTRLVALERHQPGKIPVVLVHGLVSGPTTWEALLTFLNNDPDIRKRYEFWAFRYPTGESYLIAAADLRRELQQKLKRLDPDGRDPALQDVVLIGHSMGGIVSKLQVTRSDDLMWESVSQRPFAELKADEPTRKKIHDLFFFEPQPAIKRVVFIATPHHGSKLTESFVGKLARQLVFFPAMVQSGYHQLLQANSDALLPTNSMTVPTSVDHLAPDSPVLKATNRLPFASGVHLHSIIGTAVKLPNGRVLDGVVTLESARLPNVDSELLVPATHTEIHRDKRTFREIRRILVLHAQELDQRTERQSPVLQR